MYGCSVTSALVANAEVDSMGGVIEGGLGVADRTSPRKAAIDRVQAEIRQEYDGRGKSQKELEFLEKGGNLLDYELDNAASVSVQSTSFVGQQPDQFVDSGGKCNLPCTSSPHGDSVESSGQPGEPSRDRNSADNLMLFDAEPIHSEGDQNTLRPSSSKTFPSEQSLQMDGIRSNRELGDSAALSVPGKAYKRRNRSRPNRDGGRATLNDPKRTHGNNGSSLPAQLSSRDVKGLVSDGEHNVSLNFNSKPTNPVDKTSRESLSTEGGQQEAELKSLRSAESTKDQIADESADAALVPCAPNNGIDGKAKQGSPSAVRNSSEMDSDRTDVNQTVEENNSASVECHPSETAIEVENQPRSQQMNGKKDDRNACISTVKGLVIESSSPPTNISNAENNDGHTCPGMKSVGSNGESKSQNLVSEGVPALEIDILVNKEKQSEKVDSSTFVKDKEDSTCQSQRENGIASGPEEELCLNCSAIENMSIDNVVIKGSEACGSRGSESGRNSTDPVSKNYDLKNEAARPISQKGSMDTSNTDFLKAGSSNRVSSGPIDSQASLATELKVKNKTDEDSILKEAQIIQAKRRRIAQLSFPTRPTEIFQRAHWDNVLEEMAWLANDFAQERIWKIAAAAHISYDAAFTSYLRKQEKGYSIEVKEVARKLARAVMEFWLSVDNQFEETKENLEQHHQKNGALSVRAYAVRYLKYNRTNNFHNQVDMPLTPDRISDYRNFDTSRDSQFPEENLVYLVSAGAMQAYRKSVESHVAHPEVIGCSAPEEVETSGCDAVTAIGSEGTACDEDEGETSTYNMSDVFESSKSSRFAALKRKHSTHAYGVSSYEIGSDSMQSAEGKFVSQQSASTVKRPGSNLNVSIPTKRVRTASRRVISPFSAVGSGSIKVPIKADASSGDTNSYQDDQSTLRGGLLLPNSLEVESAGDFEKHLPFDSAEVSTKPKKRKKPKHLNADYEQRWQADLTFQNDQFERDHLKKRSESHQLESNGNISLSGQSMMKKPKIVRQSHDATFDNIPPAGGSRPSPAASQMSNMSNSNKFIKILGGRDRFRKDKSLKSPSGRLGSGSPWSLFEDQALVVLVHDLGSNWELISDALNSISHFKPVFRKAKECKERHYALMDRTTGDGADSAEDSGSSQAYAPSLAGIPKGSARQLFLRLQGPIEEDKLNSHFEKIITIMQKQHGRKTQLLPSQLLDIQDSKRNQPPHSSHAIALSQVCSNNLNGGPFLTPLDLCDANPSGPEMISLGYQGPQPSGLAIANQGNGNSVLPAPGPNPALQGSPSAMIGNNFTSSPGRLNSSMSRDARYPVPRSASLSAEQQQQLQLYNQMISGRNMSPVSSPGVQPGTERGARILPGGNGVGIVGGVNRSLPMVRPGTSSPSVVNSGSIVSSGMSSAGMHSGLGPAGQGSSVLKPREPLQMMRPGLGPEQQRQMMMSEHPMTGSSQGVSHFGGLSAPFANQTSPPVSSYAISHPVSPRRPHHQHVQGPSNHTSNAQQQAYAIRLAKERQLQQRFLQQQQQQYAASNSLMPNVQPQSQHPISPPMANNSQVQSQASSPVSLSPLTTASSVNSIPQHQQKPIAPNQVAVRGNAQAGGSGLASQEGKQRQRQQLLSQANRQHPQQRAQLQAQQQAKVAKGVGRGNMMMHQNISVEPSLLNGVSTNSGTHFSEKGEPGKNVMQSQSLYTSSAVHPVQPARQYVATSPSNESLPQQKLYPGQVSSLPKNLQTISHTKNASQAHVQPVLSGSHQSIPSLAMAGSGLQQTPSNQRLVNQTQTVLKRVAQPNSQVNSGPSTKLQSRDPNADDQHSNSTSSPMDPQILMPQASNSSANITQVPSPANAHQWHTSEQLMESNALNSASNMSSQVCTPSNVGEACPQVSQGHSQKPASASIPSVRHEAGAQWQQQQSQGQQPQSPVNQQPHLPTNSQQQAQLLQGGNGDLSGKSNDPMD